MELSCAAGPAAVAGIWAGVSCMAAGPTAAVGVAAGGVGTETDVAAAAVAAAAGDSDGKTSARYCPTLSSL
ncbi:hypothetical protein DUNSADRAFT_7583 [Dunaliella salina]|uniref:Secreted protein n=1 Tax=Dunaliella salina TaxID=3046 RepID=A0ABQ7GL12_DUNSA|nr:hypothetical protein DUNSADRAFT_7583 [Dunaliella salina]|eukprot:KAF5835303.1 hypothetical protein DUNSADRAFT_7583 [Dunaliella salina]